LRGRVWKILLGTYRISALHYVILVERGGCAVYDKIKNDTFRTMPKDAKFTAKVSENMLSRVLNAFVWKAKEHPPSRLMNLSFSYVQGMNVLAAPFLYTMPELDAFYAFSNLIQHSIPLYVQPALEGVHCGLALFKSCLRILDSELYHFLRSKRLPPKLYAFASILTLSACTPPLDELLKLWDFLFAYGVHLNILCIVAQVIMMRDDLLKSASPMKLLRRFPPLRARAVIDKTVELIAQIPDDLYDMLVRHAYDPTIYDLLQPERGGDGETEEDDEGSYEDGEFADDEEDEEEGEETVMAAGWEVDEEELEWDVEGKKASVFVG
ncbi:rab-GTPase-TBC domain-containing protein, partial [Cladochytrium replicatum]